MSTEQADRIAALTERTGRLLTTASHAEGLLPVHWETLRYLESANRFSRTPLAVSAYLGLTKGTVSQTLSALEAKGLIAKETDPKDRRSKRLSLSRKGRRLLRRDPLGVLTTEIDALSLELREGLENGLTQILLNRLAAQNRAPFGQCKSCAHFIAEDERGSPHYCGLLKAKLSVEDAAKICVEQTDGTSAETSPR